MSAPQAPPKSSAAVTIRERYGETRISLQVVSGNMPLSESERTVRLFGEQVLPKFA